MEQNAGALDSKSKVERVGGGICAEVQEGRRERGMLGIGGRKLSGAGR